MSELQDIEDNPWKDENPWEDWAITEIFDPLEEISKEAWTSRHPWVDMARSAVRDDLVRSNMAKITDDFERDDRHEILLADSRRNRREVAIRAGQADPEPQAVAAAGAVRGDLGTSLRT